MSIDVQRSGQSEVGLPEQLSHIAEVSRNARGTWLSLMAVLLFSAIAVAGVKDQDFFVYGAGMSLPVINFTVPVKSFFYAGPVIVLGLYTYLHLYLLKLWRALAVPPARLPDGRWLDDAVFPWLVSDAAISVRQGGPKRHFDWLTKLVAVLFLWAAGPLILLFFWWRSFPPHDLLLTSWTGFLAGLSLIGAVVSFNACGRALRQDNGDRSRLPQDFAGFAVVCALVAGAGVLMTGVLRTVGTFEHEWVFFETYEDTDEADKQFYSDLRLKVQFGSDRWIYSANLYRAELVQRSAGWMSLDEAWEEFKTKFSGKARKDISSNEIWLEDAKQAFDDRRKLVLENLRANDFRGVDFRRADLREAFLPGLDLSNANLREVKMTNAYAEGVKLRNANLIEANLVGINLQNAGLQGAFLQRAELDYSNLRNADLDSANLKMSSFEETKLQDADLHEANLRKASFFKTEFQGANLEGADFQKSSHEGTVFKKAYLVNADFQQAFLESVQFENAYLAVATFSGSMIAGNDLSSVSQLTQTQINSAFGDASTVVPNGFDRPPHWPEEELSWTKLEQAHRDWLWLRPQKHVEMEWSSGHIR